jgi:hypothetical protein
MRIAELSRFGGSKVVYAIGRIPMRHLGRGNGSAAISGGDGGRLAKLVENLEDPVDFVLDRAVPE